MKSLLIPPPLQGLFCAGAMWALATNLPSLSYAFVGQRPLGFIIIGGGLCLDIISILKFRQSRTTVNPMHLEKASALVTTGLYTVSRNPMYLGLVVILSGWAVLLGNPLNILTLGCFVLLINRLQIIPEESVLLAKFGNQYSAYTKKVRRWI